MLVVLVVVGILVVNRGVDVEVFIVVVGIIVVGALIVDVRVVAVVYVNEGTIKYILYEAMVIFIPDVIFQYPLKLPVDDRDVILVILCCVVTPVINVTGGVVEEV